MRITINDADSESTITRYKLNSTITAYTINAF